MSIEPSRIMIASHLLPEWLEVEAGYANEKHSQFPNPQSSALTGGLRPGGDADRELLSRYGRFWHFHDYPEPNERTRLMASQALGKFVSTGRALQSILLQKEYAMSRDEADEATFSIARQNVKAMHQVPFRFPDGDRITILTEDYAPLITSMAEVIEAPTEETGLRPAIELAGSLVLKQAELFVAYTAAVGMFAAPGVSSTDGARRWNL